VTEAEKELEILREIRRKAEMFHAAYVVNHGGLKAFASSLSDANTAWYRWKERDARRESLKA
jgi:hypothetical protein